MKHFFLISLASVLVQISAHAQMTGAPTGDCGIDTETEATVPADRTRKKIGVGERVTLTARADQGSIVTWILSPPNEGYLSSYAGNPVTFTAYEQHSTPTISATYNGCSPSASVVFDVVEPESEAAMGHAPNAGSFMFPPNMAGLSATLIPIVVSPTDVSFKRVKVQEVVPNLAENFKGCLSSAPAHTDGGGWQQIGDYNNFTDEIGIAIINKPWCAWSYQYTIPVQWQVVDKSHIGNLPNRIQEIAFDGLGTASITKLGITVSRTAQ
jgi:hypothetical protein